MACNCIEEVNAKLAEHNAEIVVTFYPLVRPIIETQKVDTKKRGKPPLAVATFCPFCGVAYSAPAVPVEPQLPSIEAQKWAQDRMKENKAIDRGKDEGATFVLGELARMLGVADWTISNGSETWEGDVLATAYSILVAARVLDSWDNSIARHAKMHEEMSDSERHAKLIAERAQGQWHPGDGA